MQLKALLLDLDGTLVDTAPDMVATLNRVLHAHDAAPVDFMSAKHLVSCGARALLEFGFENTYFQQHESQLIKEFLSSYHQHVCVESALYDGMQSVLQLCQSLSIRWGVVTNKPYQLSHALLEKLDVLSDCEILLGGDSLQRRKPYPDALLHCCMQMQLAASECLYVGDHERDIIAGNAAGMDTAVAQWGYIDNSENTENWQANYLIRTPQGLERLLRDKHTFSC